MLKGVLIWYLNSLEEFIKVQNKIKDLVVSGQLGIFVNGYWGYLVMKLLLEVNLIVVVYYLQVLECQCDVNCVVVLLGGKMLYIQNLVVGGVVNLINFDGLGVLNFECLMYIKFFIDKLSDFVEQVYKVDIVVIVVFYLEWLECGKGVVNYLSVLEFLIDSKNGSFLFSGGYIENVDLFLYCLIIFYFDEYLIKGIQESVKYFWYKDEVLQVLWEGIIILVYDGWFDDGKYFWVKLLIFYGKMVEVGLLVNMLVKLVVGCEFIQNKLNEIVVIYQKLIGNMLEVV